MILVALFFGFYLLRVNYAFMVIAITVMVSQLYMELDEFSNSLLWLRLEGPASLSPPPSNDPAAATAASTPPRR